MAARLPLHNALAPLLAATLGLALTLPSTAAVASTGAAEHELITGEMVAAGLLNAHPDLKWRSRAQAEYDAGRRDGALALFKRAARYADKPSAAMVAEMYWNGDGVEQDRALGYAWMDLAAERGWTGFLARREAYWLAMDEAERARALEVGKPVYAEFGDAVAKPRKEKALNRERRLITGSRVGFVGSLAIEIPGPSGNIRINGDDFYDRRVWEPARFWAWQDEQWRDIGPGRVDVGTVQELDAGD